jgi:sterol 3beta-glucosyltransferase
MREPLPDIVQLKKPPVNKSKESSMNITILTIGSRGDVQPFVALGVGLEEAGHEVTLATGKAFEAFVAEHGLRHFALEVDLLERLQSPEGKAAVSGKKLLTTMKKAASMYSRVLNQEWAASQGADALVYHPKALGGYHIAEALDVPGFLTHPVPMFSPTRAFPNPVLPVTNLGGVLNRFSYEAFLRLLTAPYHRTINRWRKETLKLPPTSLLASELEVRGRPIQRLLCCSSHVVSPPSDWDDSTSVTGYWFLDGSEKWQPPAHLAEFLKKGPAPIYVGFGSLGTWASQNVINATLAALKHSGQRSVLTTSAGRVPLNVPDDVCVIDSAPHEWLFPKMAAVVHHGGAGTTAEGLRAGKPTLICPTSMNDQAFWGRRAFELGVGPKPIPQNKLTAEMLGRAIHGAVTDGAIHRRAEELGQMIRAERGVVRAVEIIEERMGRSKPASNR